MYKFRFNNSNLKNRRKALRVNQTGEENILWEYLRGKRLNGLKFYRQYSVGPYILDFYCPKIHLGVELDGNQHKEEVTILYDKDRDRYLQASNICILRFWNDEIINNIELVLNKIRERSSPKIPS